MHMTNLNYYMYITMFNIIVTVYNQPAVGNM